MARVFASQRVSLLRYTTRLLEGDATRAEAIVDAALEELLASPPDDSDRDETEQCFAGCRRHAHALTRQENRARRFVEPPGGATQVGGGDHTALLRQINALTPKQQEVVRLKFQNGFNHPAIARIIDLPRDKVGTLIHTALVHLRTDTSGQTPVDDARITAAALGEQTNAEREAFTSIFRDDPAIETKVTEIRTFAESVEEALGIEAGSRTPRRVAGGDRNKSKLLRRPALWFTLAAASLIGLGIFFVQRFSQRDRGKSTGRPSADFTLKPASWRDPVAGIEKTGSTVRPSTVARGRPTDSTGESADMTAPSFRSTLRRTESARSDGPTTGERVTGKSADLGATDGPAAAGNASPRTQLDPKLSGNVDAPRAAPPERSLEKKSPAASLATADSHVGQNDSAAPNSRGERPRPARAASKAPGAAGGADFRAPSENPVSALPSDFDVSSVPALFKTLRAGERPAPATVRGAELLNYFPPTDPAPNAPADFAASMESSEAPWAPTHRLVRIGLKGREAPLVARPRANLVFLLDVSASMEIPTRLPLVQEAMRLLLPRLRPDDRVAIVTYAGESQLALPSTPVADGARIRHVLGSLHADGQTNGGAGIQLAYAIANAGYVEGGANRVILCTDGDFNIGVTDPNALSTLAAEKARENITISVFGFGRGHGIDARLESLAAQGHGRSGYVNDRREAERALADEIDGLFAPIARDLKLEVAFNPAVVAGYRLLGTDDREIPSADAPAQPVVARVVGSGHSVTALYEIIPTSTPLPADPTSIPWLTFRVDYQEPNTTARRRLEFPFEKPAGSFAAASHELKFAAAVAGFGLVLSDSPGKGTTTLPNIIAWAEAGRGDDPAGYRTEFIELVQAANALAAAPGAKEKSDPNPHVFPEGMSSIK